MRRMVITLACAAGVSLAGCDDMSHDERVLVGGLTGAAVGIITANALDLDNDWIIVAALAGAAAGTLVAHNEATHQCAYARGDRTYRVDRCPPGYRNWR